MVNISNVRPVSIFELFNAFRSPMRRVHFSRTSDGRCTNERYNMVNRCCLSYVCTAYRTVLFCNGFNSKIPNRLKNVRKSVFTGPRRRIPRLGAPAAVELMAGASSLIALRRAQHSPVARLAFL